MKIMQFDAKNPIVSVIIPVYNVVDFLTTCINSVTNQSYKNLDIIIVNDGSTDDSLKICEKFSQKDKRIRLFSKSNGGLSSARNFGLDKILYEGYVAFVDSDDWIEPDMFSILIDVAMKTRADCVACGYYLDYSNGRCKVHKSKTNLSSSSTETYLRWFLDGKLSVTAWSKIYKNRIFDKQRFPDAKLHEDIWIFLPILNQINKLVVINKPLYHYNQREGSIMARAFNKHRMEQIRGIESWFGLCAYNVSLNRIILKIYIKYSWYLLVYMKGDFSGENEHCADELVKIIQRNNRSICMSNKWDSFLARMISLGFPYKSILLAREFLRKIHKKLFLTRY